MVNHFDKIPEDVRNRLLFTLAEKDKAAKIVKQIMRDHFYELPENIRNLGESI